MRTSACWLKGEYESLDSPERVTVVSSGHGGNLGVEKWANPTRDPYGKTRRNSHRV